LDNKKNVKTKDKKEYIKFQFEGPFDSSYSLAILNSIFSF